ncbi:MAG: hypothetical protein JJU16_05005 [Alkalibacterium sp.]|nr:hypothetical protein [Alkalibacterium sp.]
MSKDKELKRPDINSDKGKSDPAYNQVVSPDTSAPLGYIKDRPLKDKLSEEKVAEKAKGETVGNEIEKSLNPDEENGTADLPE